MSCIRSCYDKDSSNFGHDDCPTCIHKDAPPQRAQVELTGFEQKELMALTARNAVFATEAKLKEKNE